MSVHRHTVYLKPGGGNSQRISDMLDKLSQAELERNFDVRTIAPHGSMPPGIHGAPTIIYVQANGPPLKVEREQSVDLVRKIVDKIISMRPPPVSEQIVPAGGGGVTPNMGGARGVDASDPNLFRKGATLKSSSGGFVQNISEGRQSGNSTAELQAYMQQRNQMMPPTPH